MTKDEVSNSIRNFKKKKILVGINLITKQILNLEIVLNYLQCFVNLSLIITYVISIPVSVYSTIQCTVKVPIYFFLYLCIYRKVTWLYLTCTFMVESEGG